MPAISPQPALGALRDLSGVPELARLLRLFEREAVEEIDAVEGAPWHLSSRWGTHPDNHLGNPRVYHLAEPEIAAGMCYAVSLQLCDFLRLWGYRATNVEQQSVRDQRNRTRLVHPGRLRLLRPPDRRL